MDFFEEFKKSIEELIHKRKNPLLLMYYSFEKGEISKVDLELMEETILVYLEKNKLEKIPEIDILIQTRGGEANSAYRLIQLIRHYCNKVNALVPTYAYSGGTMITFGCDEIDISKTGVLGPIDVQLGLSNSGQFPLLNVEKYLEFIRDCYENKFNIKDEKNKVDFSKELTCKLVNSVDPLFLGELFRLKTMTELHAKTLLKSYLLRNHSNKKEISEIIIEKFTGGAPNHNFDMDYFLLRKSSLPVDLMNKDIYIHSKKILNLCKDLEYNGIICKFNHDDHRLPYFKIFNTKKNKNKENKKNGNEKNTKKNK